MMSQRTGEQMQAKSIQKKAVSEIENLALNHWLLAPAIKAHYKLVSYDGSITVYLQIRTYDNLKEHRKAYYSILCMKLELNDHLREINRQAVEQIELITSQLAQAEGVTEQLKARDQLGWVQAMNSCRARAEEVAIKEIVLAQEKWILTNLKYGATI